MKAEKKKIPFGGLLLIYITVMLTVIFAALAFLWHYLSCYEDARVEGVVDRYMAEQLCDELQYAMDVYSFDYKSEYQSMKDIFNVLSEKLGSDNWNYRKINAKSNSETMVYALQCGNVKVGELTVSAIESVPARLGFQSWEVTDSSFDLAQFGDTITVIAPYGCEVIVNGIPVGDDDVDETMGLYPQLEEFETLITQPNQLMVYRLHPIFEEVAVELSTDYTMVKDEESGVIYGIPVCGDEMADELITYCKDFVKAYVDYTANKRALWAMQQFIVPDCALYEEMTASSSGLKWGHGVNANISKIDIKNFKYYGNAITCEASYYMTRSDGDRGETMEILLVETILGWRVIHIEVK